MLPGSGLALVALLALVPGSIFLRLRQRHAPAQQSAGLGQLLEVIGVGLATTGTAAAVLVVVPHRWLPFLADIDAWALTGGAYAAAHPRNVVASAAALLLLACCLAAAADRVTRRERTEIRLGPGVWVHALRERPEGTQPYLALALNDGTLVEGLLHSFSLEPSEVRDLALRAPIRVTPLGGACGRVAVERIVVPEREIRYITVQHVPEATGVTA